MPTERCVPPRVVVVGNGMAGSRLVEEIRAHDPRRLLPITVLGAEVHAAYNRVLLSEVLAGRHTVDDLRLAGPAWAADLDVDLRLGSRVTDVDREHRQVRVDDGATVAYDLLVLATGSRAVVPDLAGLRRGDGSLLPGAFVFRTVDDCRELVAAASGARRAAVLGGGLLGLEAARGLAGRGVDTVLVHRAGHLI
jgi:assimilatory nitrate reductase electron transfer subunit